MAPQQQLDDADKAVLDSESVAMFESQTDDDPNQPPSDPQDPPNDPPNNDDPPDPNQPPAEPPATTRQVVLNGAIHEVPAEVAESIDAERQRIEDERQRLEQERRTMADQPPNRQDPPSNEGEGFDEKFWANPRAAIQDVVQSERDRLKQELTDEQRKKDEQTKFWSDFYNRYPELKGDSDIVEMTLNRGWNEFARMEVSRAMDELATRSADRIGKTLKTRKPAGDRHRTATEPATAAPAAPKPGQSDSDEPPASKSLSQLLKDRRAKRRQAG